MYVSNRDVSHPDLKRLSCFIIRKKLKAERAETSQNLQEPEVYHEDGQEQILNKLNRQIFFIKIPIELLMQSVNQLELEEKHFMNI